MEFLRFGSSIPGAYWGCCACCIIQNFKVDPDDKSSIQLVDGDGGNVITGKDGGSMFAGPTNRDIFKQRLRIGTFSSRDMPNHAFLAILTDGQIRSNPGKKWLPILKEEGFEFIRSVDNSVYTGDTIISKAGQFVDTSSRANHIFGLFRNIGTGALPDPFTPPDVWTELPDPYGGDMSPKHMQEVQLKHWEALGKPKFLTEAEVLAAGAPIILAGQRSKFPQQKKDVREKTEAMMAGNNPAVNAVKADPFAAPAAA